MYPTEQDLTPIYRRIFAIEDGKRSLILKRLFAFIANAGFTPNWFMEMPETNIKNYRSQTVRINFSGNDFEYKKLYLDLQGMDAFEQIAALKSLLRSSVGNQTATPIFNSTSLERVEKSMKPTQSTQSFSSGNTSDQDSVENEKTAEIEKRRKQNAKMYL